MRDKPPPITKVPVRWRLDWEWERPNRYLFVGLAGCGKSNLNEHFAANHRRVLDIFSSRDNESLCWLRKSSPFDDILLFGGDNSVVESSWPYKKVSDLRISDFTSHEAVVTADAFYTSQEVKFASIQQAADLLYLRKSWKQGDIIYLLLRETMSLLYSRISLGQGEKEAKAALLTFLRELRHFGVSFGADSLRWTGIEKELRDLADYTIFKQLGEKGLPADKRWLYTLVRPQTFAHMKPNESIVVSKEGSVAYLKTPLLPYHKQEGVNLLDELGISVSFSEEIEDTTSTRLGDREHESLVRAYLELESMEDTAKKVRRGLATVSRQVAAHNSDFDTLGQCRRCARLGSDLAAKRAQVRAS
ncbi:MAG: hypothetical protein NTV61_11495 [Candidatus Bathyarchaeota archaeon]|nr:hypothetical protein [Candidatus Bathyarchaeota archaeon]